MRRAPTLATAALAAAGAMALAGAASAQATPGQAQGLRYLSWDGRGEIAAPLEPVAATPAPTRRDLRRPNPVIPHGGFAVDEPAPPRLTAAPGPVRRSLTPANAWMRPTAAPPPDPMPAPAGPVVAAPRPNAPTPSAGPEYLPDQGGRGQPAPAEIVQPAPPRPMDISGGSDSDPMAPRRDAPIFRMQQDRPADPAPQPVEAAPAPAPARAEAAPPEPRIVSVANTGERPPRQGARYYSVHRQNGREPDALTMPTPTYVDALVVTMAETPATQDLAQPVEGPAIIRDRNGNMRAAPAASDGDHQ